MRALFHDDDDDVIIIIIIIIVVIVSWANSCDYERRTVFAAEVVYHMLCKQVAVVVVGSVGGL